MEREIVLSSSAVKNVDSNKPEHFDKKFLRPMILESNKEYVIGFE